MTQGLGFCSLVLRTLYLVTLFDKQGILINGDTYQWMKSVFNGCVGKEVKPAYASFISRSSNF